MFIGARKLKETNPPQKTISGIETVEVVYEDDTKEVFSKKMYDKVVSEESCDLTALRDKRMFPVVEEMASVLRSWGVKISELEYFSKLLNESLNFNIKSAEKIIWSAYSPNINSPEDVDLIIVDNLLKSQKEKPIISPYGKDEDRK